jgi:hypothetical protein
MNFLSSDLILLMSSPVYIVPLLSKSDLESQEENDNFYLCPNCNQLHSYFSDSSKESDSNEE